MIPIIPRPNKIKKYFSGTPALNSNKIQETTKTNPVPKSGCNIIRPKALTIKISILINSIGFFKSL